MPPIARPRHYFRCDLDGVFSTRYRVDRALRRLRPALRNIRKEMTVDEIIALATEHTWTQCKYKDEVSA